MTKPRTPYLRALAAASVVLFTALPLFAAGERVRNEWGGKEARIFTVDEVIEILLSEDGPLIVDARSAREFRVGHVPGALNVPHKETWGRIEEFERYRDRGIIFYCKLGSRAGIGSKGLITEGFEKVGVMLGHFEEWKRRQLPVEP